MQEPTNLVQLYVDFQTVSNIGSELVTREYVPKVTFQQWVQQLIKTMNKAERDRYCPRDDQELYNDVLYSFKRLTQSMEVQFTRDEADRFRDRLRNAFQSVQTLADPEKGLQSVIDEFAIILSNRYQYKFPEKLRGDFKSVTSVLEEAPNTEYFLMTKPSRSEKMYAQIQWETLRRTIEYHGGRTIIEDTDFHANSTKPQSAYIYSRDPLVYHQGRIFLPAYPDHTIAEYRQQEHIVKRMIAVGLLKNTAEVIPLDGIELKGGNVVFDHCRKRVFVGIDTDTDTTADLFYLANNRRSRHNDWVAKTGYELIQIPVPYDNENAYHLDTFLGVLPKGEIIFNPHWLPKKFQDYCSSILVPFGGAEDVITVNESEKSLLLTNIVCIGGKKVILTADNSIMSNELAKRGYEAITPSSMGVIGIDWNNNRAGPRCMTLGDLRAEHQSRLDAPVNQP